MDLKFRNITNFQLCALHGMDIQRRRKWGGKGRLGPPLLEVEGPECILAPPLFVVKSRSHY